MGVLRGLYKLKIWESCGDFINLKSTLTKKLMSLAYILSNIILSSNNFLFFFFFLPLFFLQFSFKFNILLNFSLNFISKLPFKILISLFFLRLTVLNWGQITCIEKKLCPLSPTLVPTSLNRDVIFKIGSLLKTRLCQNFLLFFYLNFPFQININSFLHSTLYKKKQLSFT